MSDPPWAARWRGFSSAAFELDVGRSSPIVHHQKPTPPVLGRRRRINRRLNGSVRHIPLSVGAGADMRVLIIDDSRSKPRAPGLDRRPTAAPLAVSTSTNPLEALKLSETEQFDLVIVDHIMAEMDGVDVTRWLRSRDSYRLVPIIHGHLRADPKVRLDAIGAGATDSSQAVRPHRDAGAVRNLLRCARRRSISPTAPSGWRAKSTAPPGT